MRASITSFLQGGVTPTMHDLSVEVLAPVVIANPHFTGENTLDWGNATTTSTVAGALNPATTDAVERAGLTSKRGLFTLFTHPVDLAPEGRVRVAGQQYLVRSVWRYDSHTEALVELVDALALGGEGS